MKTCLALPCLVLAVCSSLCLGNGLEQPPDREGRGPAIFVPRPRGAGESLDDMSDQASGDLVVTAAGDRLHGTVLGIGQDGVLRMTGPSFDGEVRVRVPSLGAIRFNSRTMEEGADSVTLTNGDRIPGRVSEVTPEGVVLETSLAGTLKVRRAMVSAISFRSEEGSLLSSSFARGTMSPWEPVRGVWKIQDGTLLCMTYGEHSTLVGALDQTRDVTFVADVEGMPGSNIVCEMVLFASDKEEYYGRDSVLARFTSHDFAVLYCARGGVNQVANERMPKRPFNSGSLRFAYDPAAGRMQLWVDALQLGEWAIPNPPRAGQFVLFSTQQPLRVKSLQVLSGIVPPSETSAARESEMDSLLFANGDKVSVETLILRDGTVRAKTPFGEIQAPANTVRAISVGTRGREIPRRRANDVQVETGASRLTLAFKEMNSECLTGVSDALGEVRLQRAALNEIRFNIYE